MKRAILSFVVALTLALPAGWSPLGAGEPDQGVAARPEARSLIVGEATVAVQLDADRVARGGKIVIALNGTAPTRQEIPLDVRVVARTSSPMARMPSPPRIIGSREVTLVATAKGKGKSISIALPKDLDNTTVSVQVTSPGAGMSAVSSVYIGAKVAKVEPEVQPEIAFADPPEGW